MICFIERSHLSNAVSKTKWVQTECVCCFGLCDSAGRVTLFLEFPTALGGSAYSGVFNGIASEFKCKLCAANLGQIKGGISPPLACY